MAKFLITSALPYVNGVKHLGNLAGSLLPADIHARFRRQTGHEVLFLCGTDEHGTPSELAAQAAGLPVAEYCARQHALQADIYRRFGLSFDHFSRTSGARQPAADAGTLPPPRCRRPYRAAPHSAGLFGHRQALPSRPLCGRHLPSLRQPERPRRPVRKLHAPARPRRPRVAALGDFRRDRCRVSRDAALVPETVGIRGPPAPMDRDATRLAAAGALDRAEMAR